MQIMSRNITAKRNVYDVCRRVSIFLNQELVKKTLFIVFTAGLLTWIVVHSGTSYTPCVDVFVYCLVYSTWITVCLPWLVQNMTGKLLVLLAGVIVRLFAVDVGVLAWSAFRGHRYIFQRGLRLKPLFEPSMSWLAEAGYNLRYGVVIAAVVASVVSLLLDVYERVNKSSLLPHQRSVFFKRRNSWLTSPNEGVWEDMHAKKTPRHEDWEDIHANKKSEYQEWENVHANKKPQYQEWEDIHANKKPRYQEWEDIHANKKPRYQEWEDIHANKKPRYQEWEDIHANKKPRYQEWEDIHANKNPQYQEWGCTHHREIKPSKLGNTVRFNKANNTDELTDSIRVEKRGERDCQRGRPTRHATVSSSELDSEELTEVRSQGERADFHTSNQHSPGTSWKIADEFTSSYRKPSCSKSEFSTRGSVVNDISVGDEVPASVCRVEIEEQAPIRTARGKNKPRNRAQSASRAEIRRRKISSESVDKRYVKRNYRNDKLSESEEMKNIERRSTKNVMEDTLNESLLNLRKLRGK